MASYIVGLSGGVDSAVVAAMLKEQGHFVRGAFLDTGATDFEGAAAVADIIGIPFDILDGRSIFEREVCVPFVNSYLRGETPNPCVICNPRVKMKLILERAKETGADFVATGHYARAGIDESGRVYLKKAKSVKDQSYMLSRLLPEMLRFMHFPLGEMASKDEVRVLAKNLKLPVWQKPDSMEVCFISDGDYGAFIERRGIAPPPGNFVLEDKTVIGRHEGIHRYTIGQRRGLHIAAPQRLYVRRIDAKENTVVLSFEDAYEKQIEVSDINYIRSEFKDMPRFPARIKVRYAKNDYAGTVFPEDGMRAKIVFDDKARAPAKGQTAVFYAEDMVIGAGFIG